jgi:hypothetical protein
MKDVHGNISEMLGLVRKVPLTFGSVTTWGNIFVSDQVDFDVLLGRSWFRDNRVSLHEREDGTYVSFYNPKNPAQDLEFLAVRDPGYVEDNTLSTLMSSVDSSIPPPDDEDDSIHSHPADLDETDEEDELRARINAQLNPDLTNVEWDTLRMLISEQQELDDHLETIRGLLQPSVRTRFPWGHDIFQSAFTMFIGGGMTDTRHRYEDYFLFHANRRSSTRHVVQPTGAAFVRWFPQEGIWDNISTTTEPDEEQATDAPVSQESAPPDPETPTTNSMGIPIEPTPDSPIQSPLLMPPNPIPIQIRVDVETITVISPPDDHAAQIQRLADILSNTPSSTSEDTDTVDFTSLSHDAADTDDKADTVLKSENLRRSHAIPQIGSACSFCTALHHRRSVCQEAIQDQNTSRIIENDDSPGDQNLPNGNFLSPQLQADFTPSTPLLTMPEAIPMSSNTTIRIGDETPDIHTSIHIPAIQLGQATTKATDSSIAGSVDSKVIESPVTLTTDNGQPLYMFTDWEPSHVVGQSHSCLPELKPDDTVGWSEANKDELDEDDRKENPGWYRSEAEWMEVDRIMTCPPMHDLIPWGCEDTDVAQFEPLESFKEDEEYYEDEDIATGTF